MWSVAARKVAAASQKRSSPMKGAEIVTPVAKPMTGKQMTPHMARGFVKFKMPK